MAARKTKKKTSKKASKKAGAAPKAGDKDLTPEEQQELDAIKDTTPTYNFAAENLGQRLMEHLMHELIDAGAWPKMSEQQRRIVTDRVTRRIRHEARMGYQEVMTGGVKACAAHLSKVVFTGDGIQGTLKIDKHTDRHLLSDFAGMDVLVLLTNEVDDHLEGISDLVADAIEDQQKLPLQEGGES